MYIYKLIASYHCHSVVIPSSNITGVSNQHSQLISAQLHMLSITAKLSITHFTELLSWFLH